MAPINFSQLNKTWKILTAMGGIILTATGATYAAFTFQQDGVTRRVENTDGSVYQSGSLLVKDGPRAVLLEGNGNATVDGTLSGNHFYAGTMSGAGLEDCDGDGQTLSWNATTQRFGCGDDDTGAGAGDWSGTGALQTAFDARYVNQSGDTMTGTLVLANGKSIQVSGTISGNTLKFIGSGSGDSLHIEKTLSVSGTTVVELLTGSTLRGFGLNVDCDTAGTSKVLWDATLGRFSCGTDTDTNTTYTAGQGLTLTTTSFRLNATISGSRLNFLTVSGSTVYAKNTLASSGSLKVLGNMSGASLNVNNLRSCTNLQTSAAGALSCNATAYQSTSLAEDNVWVGNGAAVATSVPSCSNASTSKLLYNTSTNAFSCGSDQNTTYTAGQGLTLSSTSFRLTASHSGTVIWATTTLRSSGSLVVEGNMSGATMNVGGSATVGSLTALSLRNCRYLASDYSGNFTCGSYPNRTIVLTAGGGLPSPLTGSGASGPEIATGTTNDTSMYVLEYGNTAKPRYAMWTATMPDNYDGGTLTFIFNWRTAATSGDVKWFIQCRAIGDAETIDQSWGTAQSVTDTAGTANTLRATSATAAVTCAGTPAGGEVVQIRVYRDPADGSDTLANTGALISVKGEYTTNAISD